MNIKKTIKILQMYKPVEIDINSDSIYNRVLSQPIKKTTIPSKVIILVICFTVLSISTFIFISRWKSEHSFIFNYYTYNDIVNSNYPLLVKIYFTPDEEKLSNLREKITDYFYNDYDREEVVLNELSERYYYLILNNIDVVVTGGNLLWGST